MQKFERGCLYSILSIIVLLVLPLVTQNVFNIPFFIAIPVILFAFWKASQIKVDHGDGGDTSGTTSEDE